MFCLLSKHIGKMTLGTIINPRNVILFMTNLWVFFFVVVFVLFIYLFFIYLFIYISKVSTSLRIMT